VAAWWWGTVAGCVITIGGIVRTKQQVWNQPAMRKAQAAAVGQAGKVLEGKGGVG